jgi:hypothetical protein
MTRQDFFDDWRWYFEAIEWPSAPSTFQAFWGKAESCGLLKLLCEQPDYEDRWKDALLYQLGRIWMAGPVRGRLGPVDERTGKPLPGLLWSMTVLDVIAQALISPRGRSAEVAHADASLLLLKHFFPDSLTKDWTVAEFRQHVDSYLDQHRIGESLYQRVIDELCGVSVCREQIDARP